MQGFEFLDKMLVSARAPGLLILMPIALVVLEIHISNFIVYFFVHNNFCKKAPIGMFLYRKYFN
jgi:hypothetical protein